MTGLAAYAVGNLEFRPPRRGRFGVTAQAFFGVLRRTKAQALVMLAPLCG